MGLLDIITGKRKLQKPVPTDRLFALSTAYVTMETEMETPSRGVAAIVFQPLDTADFAQIVRDMEEVVRGTGEETGTQVSSEQDSYGYQWMVLRDPDFDDLVVGINAVSTALEAGGYGERILTAVFAFADRAGNPLYWIYNYKRGAFHPFVPRPGSSEQRDNERELKLRAQVGSELPVEPELERWLPLWGIPI
jgi:hypothetical protein